MPNIDTSAALKSPLGARLYGQDSNGTPGLFDFTYVGPALPNAPVTQLIVKSATLPSAENPSCSAYELQHNSESGYILHLTQGGSMGAGAALIGLGIDEGGRGLFVNNKKTGTGIVVTQNDTISSATAYGILVNAGRGAAPAIYVQQQYTTGQDGQVALRLHAHSSNSIGQRLMEWRKPNGGNDGDLSGYIRASDGAFIVNDAPLIVSGGNLTLTDNAGIGGSITSITNNVSGAGANIDLYNTSGTANKRRFKFSIASDILVLSGRNDAGSSTGDIMYLFNTTKNIGLCGQNSFGGGQACIAVPNAAVVPTTNPTGGGILYCEGGALKFRGSSGTITTLGAA